MNHAKEIAGAVQKYFATMKLPYDDAALLFLDECQEHKIQIKTSKYSYYMRGEGPTVVLVHGLHSNLASMVAIAQDLVVNGYKVVLFDAPAHGEAKGISTNLPQIRQMIQVLGKQLGELHAVVCHSFGVIWALSAWGEDFNAKTLISLAAPSNTRYLVEKFVATNQIKDEVAEGLFEQLERRFGTTFWAEFSPNEIVKSIKIPGLVIHSEADDFVPASHAHEIQSNWVNSEIRIIDGDEHFDLTKKPVARELVTNYLEKLS